MAGVVQDVGLWGRFEGQISNTTSYADPFGDVALDVVYTSPGGREAPFWGFYDDGTDWRFRFMPDELGTWTYEATFSDGQPGTAGSFECVESSVPGMLAKDETNPLWFGFKGGGHVVIRGFHVGDRFFASNWPDGDRQAFLDYVRAQGYNLLSIASHYMNRDQEGRGRGWDTPRLWDSARGVPDYRGYRRLEFLLDELADRRIMVFPFAGFFGQSSGFSVDHVLQEMHIRYALARIGCYWNILLNVAGPEPMGGERNERFFQSAMGVDDIRRLGQRIADLDPFGHLITVHNQCHEDIAAGQPWQGYVTLQGWKDKDWESINHGMNHHHPADRPVYAQEVFWPGNTYGHGAFTLDEIRAKAWVLNLSAVAINFGDMEGDSSSGFSGCLDLSMRHQDWHDTVKAVWDFMESIPFYRMRPAQDVVSNGFCLAENGERYLVYLTSRGSVDVDVANGTFTVTWINARDTGDRRVAGTTTDGRGLESPDDGDDWLVYLVADDSPRA